MYNDVVYNNLDLFSDYNSRFIHSKRNLIYRICNHKFVRDKKSEILLYKLTQIFLYYVVVYFFMLLPQEIWIRKYFIINLFVQLQLPKQFNFLVGQFFVTVFKFFFLNRVLKYLRIVFTDDLSSLHVVYWPHFRTNRTSYRKSNLVN